MIDTIESLASQWIARRSMAPAFVGDEATAAVIVTGGSRGIGLAIAREFAALGRPLVLIGRTEAPLLTAARALSHAHGVRVVPLVLDVSNPEAADVLMRFLELEGLFCDVLVNNAGLGLAGAFATQSVADLDGLVATNVAGLTRLTRAVLPGQLARGRGGILSIASLGAAVPGPWQAAYYASKAYVVSLSEAVAAETAGRGVRIAVVLPGPVETTFHAHMGAETALYRRLILASSPERIARVAVRGFRIGRQVIVPGPVQTMAWIALRVLPRTLSVPIVKWLLQPRGGR